MKNFANFALAGLVLVSIIKGLVGKEALDVKKIITNTLVAGILIQASRFLMWAVIDISTIATAGISAFPMTFLSNNAKLKQNITDNLSTIKTKRGVMDLNYQGTEFENMFTTKPETSSLLSPTLENILPNESSVSWPFIYLGMSVFGFQNYLIQWEAPKDLVPLTLAFTLRLFFLLLFTVGLLLMLIANIMRVWLLWIFIIWSPFLILVKVFDKKLWEWSWWLAKLFSTTNLISSVFKPVIFVAGMSLMLIVIISIQTSITWSWATRENNLNGVSLTKSWADTSVLNVAWISSIAVSQKDILGADVIGKNASGQVQNFFSNLIMMLLCLFLMRQFIKLSLTLGGWTISETMEKLIKNAEGMAKTMPILPIWWWLWYSGMKSLMAKNKAKTLGGFGLNPDGEFGTYKGKDWFTTNQQAFENYIGDKYLWELPWWDTGVDDKALESTVKNIANPDGIAFFAKSKELAQGRRWGISRGNTMRLASLKKVLASSQRASTFGFSWILEGGVGATDAQLEAFFTPINRTALRNAMWWAAATLWQGAPANYAALKATVFYPGTQK